MPCLDQEKWPISVGSECSNKDLWALGIRNRQENLWIFVCFNCLICTWNSKQPGFFNGCFNWMIPNHYIKKLLGNISPNIHEKNGCLGYKRQGWKFGNFILLVETQKPLDSPAWILKAKIQHRTESVQKRRVSQPAVGVFFFFWFLCAPQAPLEPRKGGGGEFRLRPVVAFGTTTF